MRRGFSLVEVVIAVGIVATSVVCVLALLPSLVHQSAETADSYTAQRLTGSVRATLVQESFSRGFVTFAGLIPEMHSPTPEGWILVATSDGGRSATSASGAIQRDQQYFAIEVWRFPEAPLRFDSAATVLPLHVRVSWPYHVPGVEPPIPLSQRSEFSFNLALDR